MLYAVSCLVWCYWSCSLMVKDKQLTNQCTWHLSRKITPWQVLEKTCMRNLHMWHNFLVEVFFLNTFLALNKTALFCASLYKSCINLHQDLAQKKLVQVSCTSCLYRLIEHMSEVLEIGSISWSGYFVLFCWSSAKCYAVCCRFHMQGWRINKYLSRSCQWSRGRLSVICHSMSACLTAALCYLTWCVIQSRVNVCCCICKFWRDFSM